MSKTFELMFGPKDKEHTSIHFTDEKEIEAAWTFSEQIDEWVLLTDSQIEKLANQKSVQTAMSEHLYQVQNEGMSL